MGNLSYFRNTDNVAAAVTPTVDAGTEDTDYPVAGLVDLNPAKASKLTTTTGAWLWDFGSAQRVDAIALIHHNLDAALANVKVQMNATDAWTSPSLEEDITIPAYRVDGFPENPWLDLTDKTGYLVAGYQFLRLEITDTANSVAIALGEVILANIIRTLEVNIHWQAQDSEDHRAVINRTDWGVQAAFDRGTSQRRLVGEVDTTDAGLTSLRDLHRDARQLARPFTIIPDNEVNEAWLVRATEERFERTYINIDSNQVQMGFEEVSRGLVL